MIRGYDTSALFRKGTILRIRQRYAEIAKDQQSIKELEAQLPSEEQFRLKEPYDASAARPANFARRPGLLHSWVNHPSFRAW